MRSNLSKIFVLALSLFILATFSPNSSAQTPANTTTSNVARITQAVRENDRVTLKGNTHPLASAKNDAGVAPDTMPMERMLLVLKRSADQETSLKALMEGQQSKSSPNFHQWLTPEQFGQQFGVSDSDIQAVTAWLQTHGFTVNRVATGKMLIEFSGTAGQVREAFQTQIHKYMVKGEEHWANASDPTIPSALAPVVSGVNTLHNFGKKPMIEKRGTFSRATASGVVTPLDNVGCNGTSLATPGATCLGVSPADFAAIYKVPATVAGVAAGTGQTIAIVGDSNICTGTPLPVGCTTDDILNFRTIFGLPLANTPKVILDGPDPGLNGDEIEADLDVEYSGAVAPNAQILLVIASGTQTSHGIDLAAERIIDFNLAPVMSESFGACEGALGTAGNAFYASLWEQAAAQGITVIISAGDNGSAGCDNSNLAPNASQFGLNVNGIASTPFTVAAGGTDFDFAATGYPGNFWNSTNGANGLSAKGYVPETTWNDTCAQSGINGCSGLTTSSSSSLLQTVGGSGGQSNCADQDIFQDCIAPYAKPTWQSGSGVPNDMARDLPDISLFSSSGQLSGSFYIICASDIGGTCATGGSSFSFIGVGGTSAAAPAFAGIMALVNQNMVSNSLTGRQGNANFVLYPMSAAQTEANCNSSAGPASNCVFNDVTKGNNSVPCFGGTFGCSNTVTNSPNIGVLETVNPSTGAPIAGTLGFNTGTGYDLATGLGSLNVTNLVSGWPAASGAFSSTTTTLTLGPLTACPGGTPSGITNCINITHGTNVNVNIGVTGPGTGAHPITAALGHADDASLIGTCQTATPNCFLGGANTADVDRFDAISGNVNIYPLTAGAVAASTVELIGGRYNVTAHYAGDGFNGASDSTVPYQVNVAAEGSRTTVSVSGNTTSATSAVYGATLTVRMDIVGAASGFETGTGQVTLNDTFAGSTPVVLNLNSDGHAELRAPNASTPGNGIIITVPAMGTGVHNFSASYAGDASYNASTSVGVPFTITQASTLSSITTFPTNVLANTNFTLAATVSTNSFGNAPTGNVSFFAGATLLGSAPVVAVPIANTPNGVLPVGGMATLTTAKIAASSSITAVYNGDTNYTLSPASTAVQVAVTAGVSFTVSSASNPTVVAGSPGTSVITVAPTGGFTGTVALTCSVAPSNLTSTPTCSFNPTSIVLGASQTSTLTLTTTATTSLSAYTVTVTGTSGATVVTVPVTVTVTTPGTFTLASTAIAIAAPGQSGTSTITATGTGGFTASVALSCSVAPLTGNDPPTCTVGGPINLSAGTATGTATLTVNTTAASGIPFIPGNNIRPTTRWIVGTGAAATVLMLLLSFAPMRKRRPAVVLASLFVFIGLMVAGCGSSGGTTPSNPGTTVGSYTVTVTGTGGNKTATTTVNVTLQ